MAKQRKQQFKRTRLQDKHHYPGKISKKIDGESAGERHERRLDLAVDEIESVGAWGRSNGIRITFTNGGHHWKFIKGDKVAEWWPSSAKLVFDKRYKNGHHVHDIVVLCELIAPYFNATRLEYQTDG